jgi:hypothetical protein
MVQVRKPNGKFGGKATDIRQIDVNNAIRLVMDEQADDFRVRIKKPVRIEMDITHRLGAPEFMMMLGVALVVVLYLGSRVIPR